MATMFSMALVRTWLMRLSSMSHAVSHHLCSIMELGGLRQCLTGHQPGPVLVYHRDHEDRPGGTGATRTGDGAERSGRLRRSLSCRYCGWLPRRHLCAAAPAISAWHRVCPGRPAALTAVRARVARAWMP